MTGPARVLLRERPVRYWICPSSTSAGFVWLLVDDGTDAALAAGTGGSADQCVRAVAREIGRRVAAASG